MNNKHLWTKQVTSNSLLETYLDQSIYLKAWAKYDHEPPTGNESEHAEPSPNLRCQFREDAGMDTYDEDMMVFRYYGHPLYIDSIAKNILVDAGQLQKLFKTNNIENCNAIVAYQDRNLKPKIPLDPTLLNGRC